jgi:hypothetical protein
MVVELKSESPESGKKKNKSKKKVQKEEVKGIDASLIFHKTGLSDHNFLSTLNEALPDPAE